MTSDDPEQASPSLVDISQEKIENIAEKILYNKTLNVEDRQTIFFALTGDWWSLSDFHKTRGPKSGKLGFKALAEDVEKLFAENQKVCDHMANLGKKHQLPGLENVSRDTFNKNLKRSRKYLATYREFKKNREYRNRKKIEGNV